QQKTRPFARIAARPAAVGDLGRRWQSLFRGIVLATRRRGDRMRRREFIALAGGAAATWSLPAPAQQSSKLPTIGFLGTDPALWNPWAASFGKRLSELGWNEGRTVNIEYRWDQGGRPERDTEIANEFVRLNVDVVLTNGIAAATLKRVTEVIPVVFVLSLDP